MPCRAGCSWGVMAMHKQKTINLEQGWEFLQKSTAKAQEHPEGKLEPQFSFDEDYLML